MGQGSHARSRFYAACFPHRSHPRAEKHIRRGRVLEENWEEQEAEVQAGQASRLFREHRLWGARAPPAPAGGPEHHGLVAVGHVAVQLPRGAFPQPRARLLPARVPGPRHRAGSARGAPRQLRGARCADGRSSAVCSPAPASRRPPGPGHGLVVTRLPLLPSDRTPAASLPPQPDGPRRAARVPWSDLAPQAALPLSSGRAWTTRVSRGHASHPHVGRRALRPGLPAPLPVPGQLAPAAQPAAAGGGARGQRRGHRGRGGLGGGAGLQTGPLLGLAAHGADDLQDSLPHFPCSRRPRSPQGRSAPRCRRVLDGVPAGTAV